MKASDFLITTYKEAPADAEIISHQLLLRAGMIQRLTSGLYTWSPLGFRTLQKVAQVVREEMNRAGALEITMPMVQPAELWQESNRWQDYGPELLRLVDRHQRDYCLGPTHEEVITDFARRSIKSYKQLPLNLYQIQTKFRDEIRPRFGLMRAREFMMKDAYSFHANPDSLNDTYQAMRTAYIRTFERLGLNFKMVAADSGSIGGEASHEFQVLAQVGEDEIVFSSHSNYAANIELAEAICLKSKADPAQQPLTLIDTPNVKTIEALVTQHNIPIKHTIKTLIVNASQSCESDLIALIVRGDHELNTTKAEQHPDVAKPLTLADPEKIKTIVGAAPGSLGPVNLPIPYVVDRSAAVLSDFAAGANIDEKHYTGINWGRDALITSTADLRNVVEGDPSPDGQGTLTIKRGIEVGHIFKLGDKYSRQMQFEMTMDTGQNSPLLMGCYGIGVSRIVAAAIEQNHDDKGIIWHQSLAPFEVAIVEINPKKDSKITEKAEIVYKQLTDLGWDVLLDDRAERPGTKFADLELIGIPHRLVISPKLMEQTALEYMDRRTQTPQHVAWDQIDTFMAQLED